MVPELLLLCTRFFTSVLHALLAHVDLPIVDRAVEAILPVAVQILVRLVQVHLLVHNPVLLPPYDAEEETPVVEENPAADAGCTHVVDLMADSDDVVVGVDIDYYGTNLAVVAIDLPHHYYWTEVDVVDDDSEVVLPDVVLPEVVLPDVVVYHVEKRVGGSCYSMVVVVVVAVAEVGVVDHLPSSYYLGASS